MAKTLSHTHVSKSCLNQVNICDIMSLQIVACHGKASQNLKLKSIGIVISLFY